REAEHARCRRADRAGLRAGQADERIRRRCLSSILRGGQDSPHFEGRGCGRKDPGIETDDVERFRQSFLRTPKKAARHVPFMEDVVAAYYCALDKETPLKAKGILIAALGYFILPTDTIPDMIFGLGFTDDIAVLTAALTAIRVHMKPAHRLAAREA